MLNFRGRSDIMALSLYGDSKIMGSTLVGEDKESSVDGGDIFYEIFICIVGWSMRAMGTVAGSSWIVA